MLKLNWSGGTLLVLAVAFCFGSVDARAQTPVYGTDYQSFHGRVYVLDNPPSPTCVTAGLAYGSEFTFVYRFVANPVGTLTQDALIFYVNDRAAWRILPTATPCLGCLNGGPVAVTWTGFNRLGNFSNSVDPSNSKMTIMAGNNTLVSVATGNMKIVNGTVDNFLGNVGCTITNLHGAGVATPF